MYLYSVQECTYILGIENQNLWGCLYSVRLVYGAVSSLSHDLQRRYIDCLYQLINILIFANYNSC